MPNPATVGDWLAWAKTKLSSIDAERIAVHNFAPDGADRSWLITHQDDFVTTPSTLARARQMVAERAEGVPLLYLLGSQEFYGRKFRITSDVLIPRPESEAIIDLAKTLDLPAEPHILDVGTGSGCLAITLASEFPGATVIGIDSSALALEIATSNNHLCQNRVNFLTSDLLSALSPEQHGTFDLVVANLPYVNPSWDWLDQKSLSYEPASALYPPQGSAENGLSAYHELLSQLAAYTKTAPVANLILEADPCQHTELITLAATYGFKHHLTNGYALAFRPSNSRPAV